jgi:16S rRNA (guanine527-N7)-methyltransferase
MSAVPPEVQTELEQLSNVSRETLERLATYHELLHKWQARINLVSANTLPDAWRRHFIDSAQLWPLLPKEAKVITDLGSGAGFPGLVLAILGQERAGFRVHLVESDQRKGAFLREVIRATGAPAEVHTVRIEQAEPWVSDVVTARALAPLDRLLPLAAPFLGPGGVALFLKGKSAQSELTAAREWGTFESGLTPSHTDPDGSVVSLRALSARVG